VHDRPIQTESFLTEPPIYDPPFRTSATTPLDPIETCGYDRPDDDSPTARLDRAYPPEPLACTETLSVGFRHSCWRGRRQLVYDAMRRTGVPASRLSAFRECGAECYVLRSTADPSVYRIAASCCKDRFCLPCGTNRSRSIAAAVMAAMAGAPCRFVTLTLRTNCLTLHDQLIRLYRAFAKLRKTPLWKRTQTGGIAFLEVKRSKNGEHWHPHFHILTQGKYLPVQKLSDVWLQITGDSHIVDVRLVRDAGTATTYVTKYASKPLDSTIFVVNAYLDEAMTALHAKRMVLTFGTWKGLNPTDSPDPGAWERLDTLEGMLIRAAQHDPEAERIIYALTGSQAPSLICAAYAMIERPPPAPRPKAAFDQLTLQLP